MTRSYIQGKYEPKNPEKYKGSYPIIYRSSWELKVMQEFDNNSSILVWASESVKIPYYNPFTQKNTVYVPDFIVTYKDANGVCKTEIIEVKPLKETTMVEAKSEKSKMAVILNNCKWQAANQYAAQHGVGFRVMTEYNIYTNPKRKS